MSKISLKHSGGNVVSLNAPTNAPSASDVAFKLPNTDGSNGQAIVTDGSGNLSFGNVGATRNLVINGAMLVSQRGLSTTTNGYLIDRFSSSLGGIDQMQFTMSQSTDAPSGFRKSLKFDITTAESALGSDEYAMIRYITESQDIAHFLYGTSAAKTITLSFHVKAYQTGTYACTLFVGDSGRSYTANYTISQSATWEKKTLTFVGDTGGSEVNVDNGHGLYINWFMASGTDYKSSNAHFNQWGTLGSATGWAYGHNVDLLNSTDNYFQLAGVQLEVGETATDFEHRSFGDELAKCQRYFYKVTKDGTDSEVTNMPIGTGVYYTANDFRCILDHPVEMRAAPTLTSNDNSGSYYIHFNSSHDGIDRLDSFHNSRKRSMVRNTAHASGTQGYPGLLHQENSNSSLSFSAEL